MILKYCNTLESSLKRACGVFCAAIALITGGVVQAAAEGTLTARRRLLSLYAGGL